MKKFRRILSIVLVISCLFTLGSVAAFAENEVATDSTSADVIEGIIGEPISITSDIENAYIKYSRFCELNSEDNVLSFEDFLLAFNESEFSDAGLFLQSLMEDISQNSSTVLPEPDISPHSANGKWYFDTGTSLPQKANYSSYNLLTTARKGDIIYETTGDLAPIAGHASIVEGVFWSSTYNQFYIRVIEAISKGVRRGVFDEQRLADKSGTILRVLSASEDQRNSAVVFCISQLGKKYSLHTPKHSSASSERWYCSELVWAAYKNQGIELHNIPTAGEVFPADLYASNKTSIVGYSSIKPASRFTDTSGNWAKASIDYLVNNAMMKGLNSTTFAPNTIVDRVTLVTALHNLAGRPSPSSNISFPDIGSLPGAERLAVKWAASVGITGGYEDGTFKPYQQLTRQQFMVFLYRFASYVGTSTSYNSNAFSGFTDAGSVSAYAVVPMKWALTKGIINGTTSTTLSPLDPCTRAQCATIFNRFINICM